MWPVCCNFRPKDGCYLKTHFIKRKPAKDCWACFCIILKRVAEGVASITAFPCLEISAAAGSRLSDLNISAALARICSMISFAGS